ncbi:MAG TPA: amino acid adenylation domain-containing protein [Casimicrobiaceae bacterium]|nr:amino acid adenylation domain-containing protein [Casimicrobiaceae bacterium]
MREATLASGAEVEDAYPLASIQSDMLIDSMSSSGSGAYVQQAICDLKESMQPSRLERAWRHLVARHPILRTRFRLVSARDAAQEVLRRIEAPFHQLDWRDVPVGEEEPRFEAYLEADCVCGFEPERCPPLRAALFRLAGEHFRFLLTYHHALLDGRSIRIVMRELFDVYDALVAGRDPQLAPARPYRRYLEWLAKQDGATAEEFWTKALAGFVAPARLPVERSRSDGARGYASAELELSGECTERLRRFGQAHGLTVNTLLLGAWAQLLARYSGETDVGFDTILALRGDRADPLRDVVGPCINAVPMRLRVDAEMALLPWLDGLRRQWLAMRPHAWLPRTAIQRCRESSAVERAMPSLVVFERGRLATNVRQDRTDWIAREFSHRSRASHPLTLVAFEGSELLLKITYARSRYDAASVESMLGHLKSLLEGVPDHADLPLSAQPMLTASESRRILVDWNDTARSLPNDGCVHELIAQQAARTPDAIAVESTDSRVTYRELDDRANRLARHLARRCVAPETLVGLCLSRTPDLVVALLGILKAGSAYLALDPGQPPERLKQIIRQAKVSAIITTRLLARRLGAAGEACVLLDGHRQEIAQESTEAPDTRVDPEHLAYVVYTSGSTGRPKGISVPHRALVNHTLALAEHYSISSADRRLQFVSISADVLIADVFPVLIRGGTVVLRPERELLSIADFLRFVEAHGVTMTGIPSAYWHQWVEAMADEEALHIPPSLRVVISGMDRVRPEAFAAWRKRMRHRLRWCNAYGPSETTCTATIYEADLSSDTELETIPIGRPIANVRIYLLDRYANPVPVGVPGEIYIGGCGVARGYRDCPELTGERFVRDPFGDAAADRLYRTGDLGRYLPDGNIEFLGRVDTQIKIRGYRVEPGEVEAALRRLPQIREAVVVGSGSASEPRKLVAYVVAVGLPLDVDDLRRELRRSLPEYMVPACIVVLKALPRTLNGKIDHSALPEPEFAGGCTLGSYLPPRDALEDALAKIWQELLRVPRVGISDHFFDLGGDSLLTMRMLSKVGSAQGIDIPLDLFFAEATVEGLAGVLRAMRGPTSRGLAGHAGGPVESGGAC